MSPDHQNHVADARPYYQDDAVTIYHGDALDILPTLRAGSVDAVITDPPYGIGAVSAGNMASKAGGWQDMMNSALWFASWYREVDRILRSSGVFWTFCNWRSLPVVMRAALDAQLPITSCAVWDKQRLGQGGPQGLRPSYEMIALMCQQAYSVPDRGIPDVLQSKVGSDKVSGHPAEKPVKLLARLISISALPLGALIVDPFAGSGTTLRAAKDAGFRAVGIEAEERYCEMAANRLAQEVLDLGSSEVAG
jgi:site-specific DNA-methyltransferase (adenine-specific)